MIVPGSLVTVRGRWVPSRGAMFAARDGEWTWIDAGTPCTVIAVVGNVYTIVVNGRSEPLTTTRSGDLEPVQPVITA